jgi:hypothetical protein
VKDESTRTCHLSAMSRRAGALILCSRIAVIGNVRTNITMCFASMYGPAEKGSFGISDKAEVFFQ